MRHLYRFHHTLTGRILIAIVSAALLLGLILFTPWGNRALAPAIENALCSAFDQNVTLEEFILRHNRFDVKFRDEHNNTVSSQGGLSLLTLQMYAHYRIAALHPGGINPLQSPFQTDGAFKGGFSAFDIQGEAQAFGGKTLYEFDLRRLRLANLRLTFSGIAYETLMHELDYPSQTDTRVSGTINLSGLERRNVAGAIELISKTGRFTPTPIREEDNESFDWRALLADKDGTIRAFDVNVSVSASIDHAGIFEQFAGLPLSGPLEAHGSLQGNDRTLYMVLRSSIARSDTALSVRIPNLNPTDITVSMHHANVGDLFELFCLTPPVLGTGYLNAHLNGEETTLTLRLKQARTVPSVLKQEYNITQPPITFDAEVAADLKPLSAHYRGSFRSDLGRMEIDRNTTHDQMLRDLLNSLR